MSSFLNPKLILPNNKIITNHLSLSILVSPLLSLFIALFLGSLNKKRNTEAVDMVLLPQESIYSLTYDVSFSR